jgi:hypothetical protein
MREKLSAAQEQRELLTLEEAARQLKISRSSAWRLLRHEPGVNLLRIPGSRRVMIRVERNVIDRILRRTAN